jgi:3-oxoacyl-[acyl-carrier-protein] synthase II
MPIDATPKDRGPRRVVITGMGVVTPIGCDIPTFWRRLVAGESGVGVIDRFDLGDLPVRIAALVKDFEPEAFLDRKEIRRTDRFVQYALAASQMAYDDAGFRSPPDGERFGVFIGSGLGGLETMLSNYDTLQERGHRRVSPFMVPMMIGNMASGEVSIRFGAKGPSGTPVSACATGNNAIGDAFRLIRTGVTDVMLAGGAEAVVHPLALAGFASMRALSTRNDEPERASRPFDRDRDGFVMGEGAGVMVLEELEHARRRGARILAELVGFGQSSDAYHATAPDPAGEGAARAMRLALADAGLAPEEVDYVNAHATGTDLGDVAETGALKTVFGEHAYRLAVSANKSMLGHLLGAAGGVEAIATVLTIVHGIIPPTINLDAPDDLCDLDYVPNVARKQEVNVALSNGFGFGGHNAVLLFRRFEE